MHISYVGYMQAACPQAVWPHRKCGAAANMQRWPPTGDVAASLAVSICRLAGGAGRRTRPFCQRGRGPLCQNESGRGGLAQLWRHGKRGLAPIDTRQQFVWQKHPRGVSAMWNTCSRGSSV